MNERLLIWDIDGTLLKGGGGGRHILSKAFESLYGIPEAMKNIYMSGQLDHVVLKKAYQMFGVPEERQDPEAFFTVYSKFFDEHVRISNTYKIIEGVRDLLERLSGTPHIYNCLGTGNIESSGRAKLEACGINRFFPTGGFSEGETERWEVVNKAYEKSCAYWEKYFSLNNVFVIGDTPHDMECAVKLGMTGVGYSNDRFSAGDLYDAGASFVIDSYNDDAYMILVGNF